MLFQRSMALEIAKLMKVLYDFLMQGSKGANTRYSIAFKIQYSTNVSWKDATQVIEGKKGK